MNKKITVRLVIIPNRKKSIHRALHEIQSNYEIQSNKKIPSHLSDHFHSFSLCEKAKAQTVREQKILKKNYKIQSQNVLVQSNESMKMD